MALVWKVFHPRVELGLLPDMLSESDPAPAREQFDKGYRHGGGWHPMKGFRLLPDGRLQFRDNSGEEDEPDPPLQPLAMVRLRTELIVLYEYDWVLIQQPDKSFEVCRMD